MKKVSGNQHLLRRKGVYYYPSRAAGLRQKNWQKVRSEFAEHDQFGRGEETPGAQRPRMGRPLRRLEGCHACARVCQVPTHSEFDRSVRRQLWLVREYVEHKDKEFRKRFAGDPPQSEGEKAKMRMKAV